MTTYTTILHNEDVYEFAIANGERILFINLYRSNSNFPTPIQWDDLPEAVQKKLINELCD